MMNTPTSDAPRTILPTPGPQAASPGDAITEFRKAWSVARARTWSLLDQVPEDDWFTSFDPIMGPVAWDAGHMGFQQEFWLVHQGGKRPLLHPDFEQRYDAYRNPRALRSSLPLMDKPTLRHYHERVDAAMDEVLAERRARGNPQGGFRADYLRQMILLHECQHQETILQALQTFPAGRVRLGAEQAGGQRRNAPAPEPASREPLWCAHPGGRFLMGQERRVGTYDNEWPQHEVDVKPFELARDPVTSAQFLAFVQGGGYEEKRYWDPVGFEKVRERGWRYPRNWVARPDGWYERRFQAMRPLSPDAPVMQVSWYEADAFARWCGARLPTEAEWEYAATWDVGAQKKRAHPWGEEPWTPGRANLAQDSYGTVPVGSHEAGATPYGVAGLFGDVWEWTATSFHAFAGYAPFPYEEYSQIFFDQGLKVLRGGSWATMPWLQLGTFRNWDLPIRNQIFAGLRLARDPGKGPDVPGPSKAERDRSEDIHDAATEA